MPPPRLCYEVIAPSIFREGSRPSGCPRPMRRGWLRRNRLNRTLRHFHRCRRVFCFVPLSPHFYGEVSERRPWIFKREDRPKGAPNSSAAWSRRNTTEAHSQTAKLAGEQRENLGGEDRDPLHPMVEGEIEVAGIKLTVISDGSLLRLARFGLMVMSAGDPSPFINALLGWAVASAVMDDADFSD